MSRGVFECLHGIFSSGDFRFQECYTWQFDIDKSFSFIFTAQPLKLWGIVITSSGQAVWRAYGRASD